MKKKSIELQLVKPIKGSMKGRITIEDLTKEVLDNVNVAYADMCCPEGSQIPNGAPVRYSGGGVQYFDVATETWISTGGAAARFGVSGEDDTATQNRDFNINGFDFQVSADSASSSFGLYSSAGTQRRFFAEVSAPDGLGATSYVDIRSLNGGSFTVDIYGQNNNGSIWGELFINNGSLYLAHSDEIDIENGDGDILLRLITGTGIYVEVDGAGGHTIEVQGVLQDDTATKLMTLNSSNEVVWVDKATIGTLPGQSFTFAKFDTINLPTDASPDTGFNVAIETGKRYSFEAFFNATHSSGVGYNVNVDLPGSPGLSRFFVEFVSPASGGEVDTTSIRRESVIGESVFNIPNGSFNSPMGAPTLKIIGFIDINDVAGDVTITASLDAAGPQSGALEGWIKLTELL